VKRLIADVEGLKGPARVLPLWEYTSLGKELMISDFIMCAHDNTTDEYIRALDESNLVEEIVFSYAVGPSSKPAVVARYHLLEPSDIIASLSTLNGQIGDEGSKRKEDEQNTPSSQADGCSSPNKDKDETTSDEVNCSFGAKPTW